MLPVTEGLSLQAFRPPSSCSREIDVYSRSIGIAVAAAALRRAHSSLPCQGALQPPPQGCGRGKPNRAALQSCLPGMGTLHQGAASQHPVKPRQHKIIAPQHRTSILAG